MAFNSSFVLDSTLGFSEAYLPGVVPAGGAGFIKNIVANTEKAFVLYSGASRGSDADGDFLALSATNMRADVNNIGLSLTAGQSYTVVMVVKPYEGVQPNSGRLFRLQGGTGTEITATRGGGDNWLDYIHGGNAHSVDYFMNRFAANNLVGIVARSDGVNPLKLHMTGGDRLGAAYGGSLAGRSGGTLSIGAGWHTDPSLMMRVYFIGFILSDLGPTESQNIVVAPLTNLDAAQVSVAPNITTTSIPEGIVGQSYGPVALQADGTPDGYTWSVTGLPPGITLNTSTGSMGGTPSVSGVFSLTVGADNGVAPNDSQALTLTIANSASGGTSVPADSSAVSTVVISPETAALVVNGATQQFTAVVNGSGNPSQAVTWSLQAGFDSFNETTAVYTPTEPTTAVIRATSVQDSTKWGEVTISVTAVASRKLTVSGITLTDLASQTATPIGSVPGVNYRISSPDLLTEYAKGTVDIVNNAATITGLASSVPASVLLTMKHPSSDRLMFVNATTVAA